MAFLFELHLSKPRKGFGKPCVMAVKAVYAGFLADGDIVCPDHEAVRQAMPSYYRKALDRAGKFWFPADGDMAHLTLLDRRGRYLNTLYATLYEYK